MAPQPISAMRGAAHGTLAMRPVGAMREVPLDAQEYFRAVAKCTLYKPHQPVFAEGDPCAGLYLVCYGAVKLYHSDRFGREHVLAVAGPGAVLGELALDPGESLSISAEALAETQLAFLARERFESFVDRHPRSAIWLIDALSRELGRARRRVRDLALKGAEARLAALLLELGGATNGHPPGPRVDARYRRREIAEMIGVSTETAIRLLAKLQVKGVIAIKGRDIAVTDVARLTRIADHDESAT